MTPSVSAARDGRVAIIKLDRPETSNAINLELLHELETAVERFAADRGIRALIITGSGCRSSTGGDLAAMRDSTSYPGANSYNVAIM